VSQACSNGAACGCAPAPPADEAPDGCSGGESFALRVLGDSMAPEFNDGEIIIVEPDGALRDGSFVLAFVSDEWTFRQLRQGAGGWRLEALDRRIAPVALPDLSAVRGVVIQKALPGRRRASKFYI
jgi:SOS-response transcriptional repressor LexA